MVDPTALVRMVDTNSSDKETERNVVHALVRWTTAEVQGKINYRDQGRLELVSRHAEKLVAQKLTVHNAQTLGQLRSQVLGIPGAEGYADALFEAFAIRRIRDGGDFLISGLEGQKSISINIPAMLGEEHLVEISSNTLDQTTCPLDRVHVEAEDSFESRLLWPTTNNFPTFDAYYFHTDGDVYPMQMTIACKKGKLFHTLNRGGAFQTKRYLESIKSCLKKYKAIFVVPKDSMQWEKQNFVGQVTIKKKALTEEKAQEVVDSNYEQWVLPL
jgi:hypothetical protein